MRRWLGAIVLIFIVYTVATKPNESANTVKGIGNSVLNAADGFGTFFTSLVS